MFTHLLPKLLAKITGKPRYLPKIVWSKKSLVHNAFRLYELVFWRRYGIRPESYTGIDERGKVHREFYSVEAMLAHIETMIRDGFYIPDSVKVFVPNLYTPEGFQLTSGFLFAIAVDDPTAGGALGASPKTYSHTCTGSDLLLFGVTYQAVATDNVTDHTYAGDALTKIDFQPPDAGINYYSQGLWYRASPDTGANNMSVVTSSGTVSGACVSYSGCKQTGIPDSAAKGAVTSTTTMTGTTTVVADDSWLLMLASDGGSSQAAGSGTTLRQATVGETNIYDSNGTVAAGSRSLVVNWSGSAGGGYQIVSFAPAAAITTVTPSALTTALTLNAPTVVISDTVTPSALATTLTLNAPSLKTDDSFAPSAFGLTLTLNAPNVLSGKIVTPSALALTSAIPAPAVSRDWSISVSALSITSALLSTSYILGTTVTPSALALTLTVQDPASRWNNRTKTAATWTIREKI